VTVLAICNMSFSQIITINLSKSKIQIIDLAVASQKVRNLLNTTEECMQYTAQGST